MRLFCSWLEALRRQKLINRIRLKALCGASNVQLRILAKYFAHGMLFSLLSVVLFLPFVAMMLILVMFGSIIGLLIGLILFFLIVGYINSGLGSLFWEIERGEGFLRTIGHGLVLEIIFLLVALVTYYLPTLFFPGLVTQVAAFIITAPIDGAIGKQVASWFSSESGEARYEDMETREAVPSGISYTQPAPTEISEGLPICPLCQNRTKWKAYYRSEEGVKPYNIMCSVCHAEWENVPSEPFIQGGLAGPVPLPQTLAEDRFALRNTGENIGAEIFLNREITLSNWKEMVKKFCDKCGTPLAKDEDSCQKCRSKYRSGHTLIR